MCVGGCVCDLFRCVIVGVYRYVWGCGGVSVWGCVCDLCRCVTVCGCVPMCVGGVRVCTDVCVLAPSWGSPEHLALDGVGEGGSSGNVRGQASRTDVPEPWSEAGECGHAVSTHPPGTGRLGNVSASCRCRRLTEHLK